MKPKKNTRKFITKMMISGREWELFGDSKTDNSWFSERCPQNKGKQTIVIGTKSNDPRRQAEILIHEVLEAAFFVDRKRYVDDFTQNRDHTRYLFVFDHDYLSGLDANLLTALLTSGMFELKEK